MRQFLRLPGLLALTCATIGLSRQTAYADGWENVPTGSRTAAMGGAGIAGGSDSAMPIINPAGLALIPNSVASLSASLYQFGSISIPNFIADADTIDSRFGPLEVSRQGVESLEFGSFPSGIAYFVHVGTDNLPMTLAGSLSVPRNINRRFIFNTEFAAESTAIKENISTVEQEQSYMAALSWAAALGDLRIGTSVLGQYTNALRTSDRSQLAVEGTTRFSRQQVKEAREVESLDLGVIIGAQYDVTDNFQVGIGLRSPSLHLKGAFTGSVDFTDVSSDAEALVMSIQSSGDGVRGFPMRLGVGAQLKGDGWAVALDGTAYLPRGEEYKRDGTIVLSDIGGENQAEQDEDEQRLLQIEPTKARVNLAVGFEFKLTDTNWLRSGVFTEFAALESEADTLAETRPGMFIPPERFLRFPIHRVGASVGWGTRVGPIDTTFGARATYGSGDTLRTVPDRRFPQRGGSAAELTTATVTDLLLFISAAIDVSEGADKILDTVTGSREVRP